MLMGTSCTEKADIYSCAPACLWFVFNFFHAPPPTQPWHLGQHAFNVLPS